MHKRIIGIQGGKGSYNEIAILKYLESIDDCNVELQYLYSSQNVFDALKAGRINWGQFAIGNSVGGYVAESLEAIAAFLIAGNGIDVVGSYECAVTHYMIVHPSCNFDDITKIISHPQVFKQCKNNLQAGYAHLEFVEGMGDYSDPARVAAGIASGEFLPDTATISHPRIAELYGLKLLGEALQDSNENRTRFLLVEQTNPH